MGLNPINDSNRGWGATEIGSSLGCCRAIEKGLGQRLREQRHVQRHSSGWRSRVNRLSLETEIRPENEAVESRCRSIDSWLDHLGMRATRRATIHPGPNREIRAQDSSIRRSKAKARNRSAENPATKFLSRGFLNHRFENSKNEPLLQPVFQTVPSAAFLVRSSNREPRMKPSSQRRNSSLYASQAKTGLAESSDCTFRLYLLTDLSLRSEKSSSCMSAEPASHLGLEPTRSQEQRLHWREPKRPFDSQ